MSLFETLKNAIFGHPAASTPVTASQPSGTQPPPVTSTVATANTPTQPASAPAGQPSVDVEAILTSMAQKSGQKLNWQTSIVDLMKVVGLDPSLQNRKQLAAELGYKGDPNDSASMNIWLHKQVMVKLAENGGQVPASLRA
jgi:Domain of unknown function (DUF3597)